MKLDDIVSHVLDPIEIVQKNDAKLHQSPFRRLYFGFITGMGATLGAMITGMGLGGLVTIKGSMLIGALVGSFVPVPGVGTAVGTIVGLLAGIVCTIIGGACGFWAGGTLANQFAKHSARLISAIFNFKEANPTNPNKYRLTKEEEKSLNISQINRSAMVINQELRECYRFKKEYAKPSLVGRILGFGFFTHRFREDRLIQTMKANNAKINHAILQLKRGENISNGEEMAEALQLRRLSPR